MIGIPSVLQQLSRRHTRRLLTAASIAVLCSSLLPAEKFHVVWAAGNYPAVIASDAPVGYWRLDETSGTSAADSSSGHANPLTYQGGYTLATQPGAINGDGDPAVTLNGTTGAVTATHATTTSTTNWSLEAWLNPSTLPQTGVVAYNGQLGSNGYGFAVGATNGSTLSSGSHLIGIVGSVGMFDSGFNFSTANTWYHVVMTRDSTTIRFYINAALQGTTSTLSPVAPGARFSLGSGFTNSSVQMNPFAGSIDEAASYSTLLTAGRIKAHSTEGASAQSAFGNWIALSPSGPPSTRFEPAMGWDAAHNKVVLFGGKSSTGSAIQDTWTWDGTTWAHLTPSTQPSARWGAQLVYDSALGKMVLFGGTTGSQAQQDTWTWNGTTWASVTTSTKPAKRLEYGMAYDAAHSVVVMFGGNTGSAALQDTYTFNGTNWTLLSPTHKPSIRSAPAMTYNTAAGNTVLFGGVSGSTYNAETWTWNGTDWTQQTPNTAPSARANSGFAYNSLTSTVALIGGVNGSTYSGDTWTWDGSSWTLQSPALTPTVRAGAGFAYNGVNDSDSLFGGLSGSTFLNDTKTWATPPGFPTGVNATGGNAQATVSWTAPSSGGSAITGYVVTPYVGSTPGTATNASASPVTITGLTNGTTYTFKVYAKNVVGNGPVTTSNAVTPASTPGAPTNVVAAPGNGSATGSWTAPGSGGSPLTGYTVTPIDNGNTGTPINLGPSSTSTTFSSLTNGHTFKFQIYASNAIGNGPTATSNQIVVGTPTAPGSVTATAGANQATVQWTASTQNGSAITGYTVVAYIGSTAGTRVNTGPSATQATVYGLLGQTAYTFHVYATNSFGAGPDGVSGSVTPTGAGSTYESTVAGDSPVAYWRLDDPSGSTATDVTGNDNGTYNGTVTLSQSGLIPSDPDPGAGFDGSSAYVSAATITALQGDNTRSVEIWFSTTSTGGQVFFDSGTTGVTGQLFIIGLTAQGGVGNNPPANTPGLYVAFGNADLYLPGLNLGDGRTHHVVVTLSGTTVNVYVDGRTPQAYIYNGSWGGTLASQPFTLPTTPNTPSNPVWIGHGRQSLWSGSSYFAGTLDEVTVYSTVLTATQVANHESAAQVTLTAPVIGTVTPGANQVTVTWTDSSNTRAFSGYVITAYQGGTPTVSKGVASTATSAVVTGLMGGAPYTIQVSLANAFSSVSATSGSVTPTGGNSTYASTVETTAPLPTFYYRLSDSGTNIAADSSGSGQNGLYIGSPTTGVAGALANDTDTAVTFGSGYVQYSGASIPVGNTSRTVEIWLKTTTSAYQQLLGWGDGNNFGTQFDVRLNGTSQIQINVFSAGVNPYVNLPYSIANGQWHQVIVTFDGSTFKVYVDGNLAGSWTYGGISTDRTIVTIGNNFQGQLDEVAVYPGALSASQATAHFLASGNSQPAPPTTVTATAGANAATVTWNASAANAYPLLGYVVTAYSGSQPVNAQAVGPSTLSTTINGLPSGVSYTFKVAGINNFGLGTSSASSNAVTPTGPLTSTYPSTVIGTGPTGTGPFVYWRLGDVSPSPYAADSSGSAGWATYNTGTTLGAAGAMPNDGDTSISGGLTYSGFGEPTGNSSRTVEAWVKTTSTSFQSIVQWGDGRLFGSNFNVELVGDEIFLNLNNPTNPNINAPYTLANGQWHFVVVTFNGSVITAYVDGSSIGTWSGTLVTDQSVITVGSNFSGNLDDVAIYTRALSASEVMTHFLASGNSQPAASDPGTVGAVAGQNQVTVSWDYCHVTPPSSDCLPLTNPSPVIGFRVSAWVSGSEAQAKSVDVNHQSVVFTGLQSGVNYTFNVAAFNNFGIGAATTSGTATPSGVTSTYPSTIQTSLPLAYYRLGDTASMAADSSGNGLRGNFTGSYTLGVQGALTGDADTAMSGGGMQVNQTTTFPTGASARSVEIWFKTTSTSTQNLAVYGDSSWFGTLFDWQIAGSGMQLVLGTTTTSWSWTAPYSMSDGQWHMAEVTYDGTSLTMYLDANSLGSLAAGLSTVANTHFAVGPFTGSVDEVAVYGHALTPTEVSNHWSAAGAGVPGAPSNITATASQNSAVVRWTPPTPRGAPVTSYTITPQLADGSKLASLSVTGSTTSANVPALPGLVSMSFLVAAVNKYGTGPFASSPTVQVMGAQAANGMDRFLAIATGGNPARGIYYEGWTSKNPIPHSSLSQWTIEGWIWAVGNTGTSTSNMAWGLLDPSGQWGTPQAGVDFNVGNIHGIGACCDVSFVWPHNGSIGFGSGGRYTPTIQNDGFTLGNLLGGNSPVYIAMDFDGTTVRMYANGSLVHSQVDSSAIPIDAPAGFYDETALRQAAFDGFRVSNYAVYTGATFTVPTADLAADPAHTLVDYNFDNYPVGKQAGELLTPFAPWAPVSWGNWPDSSPNNNYAVFTAVTNPWEVGWFADSAFLFQPFELTPGIAPGELADECNGVNTGSGNFCQRSSDLSIPGRGPALSLQRTYNSFAASKLSPFGYGWASSYTAHLEFDGNGNATLYDPLGGNEFFPNTNGSFSTPSYVSTTLVFANGQYTLTDKHGGKLVFDSGGKLIQEVDRNGYTTTLAYTGSNLTTVTDPAGRQFSFSYGTNGLISTVTDGFRMLSYNYDSNLNLTSVVDVLGGTTTFTYDSSHRMLTAKGPICNQTSGCNGLVNVYNTDGRVNQQTDPVGNSATYNYVSAWPMFTTTVTNPLGHQDKYDYALGLPVDMIHGADTSQPQTTTYAYDPASLGVALVTNPNGESSTATYDQKTNVLTTTDALGDRATFTYNGLSEFLSAQDPLGTVTSFTYDASGNLMTQSTPLIGTTSSRTITLTYGDANHPGDITSITDPTNHSWSYVYDLYGNRTALTDPLGNKTTFAYDTLGRLSFSVSALGNMTGANPDDYTTTYTYNAAGQTLTVTDPLSHQLTNQYDVGGHLTRGIDAAGNISTFAYDLDGRLTASTAGYGTTNATTSQTTYDAAGHVLAQIDGLNHTLSSYTYDALGRQATSADGLNRVTSFSYDSANRLSSTISPLNQTTNYTYDSGGRLTSASYSDGVTSSVSYSYDADGRMLTMVDASGTTTNSWDSLDRLTQQTDGSGHTVGYQYDLAGRLTSIAYPGGSCTAPQPTLCVSRQYDNAGRVSSVQDWLSHTTDFAYDANSNLTGITYPNGVVATLAYNRADQLTGIGDVVSGNSILNLSYTRDSNAQVTAENTTSYGYNSLNQLTSSGGSAYTYDAAGRLTQSVNGSTTTQYMYDNADQLTSKAVIGGSTTTYGYDAAGRRISSGSTNLTWDQQNRLLSYGSGNSYTYNAAGLRTSKTVGGQNEAFVWDVSDGLPILLKDGSTSYVTAPGGLLLEQISGTNVYYYQQDQLGSTRILSDAAGVVVASYDYDAYGNITALTGSVANPFLFTGQYWDAESGLYYLRARYYDPSTAQFISRDPKLSSTGAPYAYVAGNPVNATDPSGMCGLDDILGCASAAAGYIEGQISAAYNAVTAPITAAFNYAQTVMSSPVGNFLMGVVAGFTGLPLSATSPDEEIWFDLGVGAGLFLAVAVVLTGPEDPLADAEGVRLATRAPEAGELALKADRVAEAAEGSGEAARMGETVAPLGRSYERYNTYLTDVASHYGINLRGVTPIFDSSLGVGVKGLTKASDGGWIIRINPGFNGEADLANTIAHELSHARDFQKGLSSSEAKAYASGDALEEWINGRR